MASALQIGGKTLHPIKDVVAVFPYSRDYVTRLAREEKIQASLIGRQWFVDLDSLKAYSENSAIEQELRKKQLSAERKREIKIRESVNAQVDRRSKKARGLHYRAAAVASFVLGFGLLGGWAADFLLTTQPVSISTQTSAQNLAQVNTASLTKNTLPAASESEVMFAQNRELQTTAPVLETSSRDVADISEIKNGFLLFPTATTSEVTALFSDTVSVKELPSGEQVVVRLDIDGNEIGQPLPFLDVPVVQNINPYE